MSFNDLFAMRRAGVSGPYTVHIRRYNGPMSKLKIDEYLLPGVMAHRMHAYTVVLQGPLDWQLLEQVHSHIHYCGFVPLSSEIVSYEEMKDNIVLPKIRFQSLVAFVPLFYIQQKIDQNREYSQNEDELAEEAIGFLDTLLKRIHHSLHSYTAGDLEASRVSGTDIWKPVSEDDSLIHLRLNINLNSAQGCEDDATVATMVANTLLPKKTFQSTPTGNSLAVSDPNKHSPAAVILTAMMTNNQYNEINNFTENISSTTATHHTPNNKTSTDVKNKNNRTPLNTSPSANNNTNNSNHHQRAATVSSYAERIAARVGFDNSVVTTLLLIFKTISREMLVIPYCSTHLSESMLILTLTCKKTMLLAGLVNLWSLKLHDLRENIYSSLKNSLSGYSRIALLRKGAGDTVRMLKEQYSLERESDVSNSTSENNERNNNNFVSSGFSSKSRGRDRIASVMGTGTDEDAAATSRSNRTQYVSIVSPPLSKCPSPVRTVSPAVKRSAVSPSRATNTSNFAPASMPTASVATDMNSVKVGRLVSLAHATGDDKSESSSDYDIDDVNDVNDIDDVNDIRNIMTTTASNTYKSKENPLKQSRTIGKKTNRTTTDSPNIADDLRSFIMNINNINNTADAEPDNIIDGAIRNNRDNNLNAYESNSVATDDVQTSSLRLPWIISPRTSNLAVLSPTTTIDFKALNNTAITNMRNHQNTASSIQSPFNDNLNAKIVLARGRSIEQSHSPPTNFDTSHAPSASTLISSRALVLRALLAASVISRVEQVEFMPTQSLIAYAPRLKPEVWIYFTTKRQRIFNSTVSNEFFDQENPNENQQDIFIEPLSSARIGSSLGFLSRLNAFFSSVCKCSNVTTNNKNGKLLKFDSSISIIDKYSVPLIEHANLKLFTHTYSYKILDLSPSQKLLRSRQSQMLRSELSAVHSTSRRKIYNHLNGDEFAAGFSSHSSRNAGSNHSHHHDPNNKNNNAVDDKHFKGGPRHFFDAEVRGCLDEEYDFVDKFNEQKTNFNDFKGNPRSQDLFSSGQMQKTAISDEWLDKYLNECIPTEEDLIGCVLPIRLFPYNHLFFNNNINTLHTMNTGNMHVNSMQNFYQDNDEDVNNKFKNKTKPINKRQPSNHDLKVNNIIDANNYKDSSFHSRPANLSQNNKNEVSASYGAFGDGILVHPRNRRKLQSRRNRNEDSF